MKDFAKSIVCNTKAEAEKVGNSYQYAGSIPIEKIPDNWRPEFPKAGYIVYYAPNKAKWFATESEAKRFAESQDKAQKTGNSKCGNAEIVKDGNTWVVLYAEGTKSKEFDSKEAADKFAKEVGNTKVGNKRIKGNYVTIDTSTGRVTFDDFAGKSFDVSRIDSSAGYELRVMQQQINDFKKALEEAKSLAKQNGLI